MSKRVMSKGYVVACATAGRFGYLTERGGVEFSGFEGAIKYASLDAAEKALSEAQQRFANYKFQIVTVVTK